MKKNEPGMTLIVKTITRLSTALILIYGIYIVLQGHIGPGGGFAGGLIIALSLIQLMLAFGRGRVTEKINKKKDLFLMSAGALVFLVIANSSFALKRFPGSILLCDGAIAVLVGSGLFTIFSALALLTRGEGEK